MPGKRIDVPPVDRIVIAAHVPVAANEPASPAQL